jgi:hypothetical protein
MTDTAMTRRDVVTNYRAAREAICQHLNAAVKFASGKAIKDAARRIGLLSNSIVVADCFSEMALAFDLVVFGARADRSRAIDRYARASRFPAGSIEATVLAAMQASTFHIVQVKERHDIAGIIVDDVFRQNELWLMDEGFEATVTNGVVLAGRLVRLDPYCTTAGATVPLDRDVFQDAFYSLAAARHQDFGAATLDDPRLPEAIYAAAIRNGAMNSIAFGGEQ